MAAGRRQEGSITICGITGFANFKDAVSLDRYYKAHLLLAHRGRDDEGFFVVKGEEKFFCRGDQTISAFENHPHICGVRGANVVLGHRRLSIIDLSLGGHQPMYDATGRYTLTYNGELYNYIELREELIQLGHQFTSESDSEVLLAALFEWGLDCFGRFNGMWALAIYDALENSLLLCRDRFGIKPMYYAEIGHTLYFASEAKFILPFLPELEMNQNRVVEYIAHSMVDHHPETMFNGVRQLRPGHFAIWNGESLREERYWQLPTQSVQLDMPEAVDQLRSLLTSSVALRLRSDVPLGSSLSGGLDSTSIVCIARQLLENQGAVNSFDLFSAVFHEEVFSERRYIEDTVKQTGLNIHWVYPDPHQVKEKLPQLLYHQDFPFNSLAVYSQWEIMQNVRQTPIVVLLNGQGSDEIFGGYTHHYHALIAEYLRTLQLGQGWLHTKALANARERSIPHSLLLSVYQLGKSSFLSKFLKERSVSYIKGKYQRAELWERQESIFQDSLVRNLTYTSLPEYLRYEDRNSMASTLESRLPFLDYRLVEWAMSLPPTLKIKDLESKRVLREAVQPLIPPSIYDRKDKMGFISPQEIWQHKELANLLDEVFQIDLEEIFPFLHGARVQEIYNQYRSGKRNDWRWVWRIVCLYWWHKTWWEKGSIV